MNPLSPAVQHLEACLSVESEKASELEKAHCDRALVRKMFLDTGALALVDGEVIWTIPHLRKKEIEKNITG